MSILQIIHIDHLQFYVYIIFFFYLSFAQLPQMNPGLNNPPFRFTKYSNAYMLVYIRESDKDKIICNVDEKDIAQHLQVVLLLLCLIVFLFQAYVVVYTCFR